MCVIILGDFRIRAGVTSRRCYQSLVYQVRCHSRSTHTHIHTHSSRCPSMALLSLCIKPFSPITLTPRRIPSIRIDLPQPPHLSRFHPRRFIEASTPSSTGSGRSGCLARSLANISARMYRKIYTGLRGREGGGGRGRRRSGRRWRRPGWFSRRVSPVTFHYRLITSEYSFRVSPCLLANP